MKELGRYDTSLEMFVETVHDVDMGRLRFQRWLAERGHFGYKPLSVPRGDNVVRLSDLEIRRYAMQQGDKELKPEPKTQYDQQIK